MQAEADRWQSLIDDLLTREKHLNASFKGDVTESDPTRFVKLFHLLWLSGWKNNYLHMSRYFDHAALSCLNNSFSQG